MFLTLLKKDLALECRSLRAITLLYALAVLLAFIISFGVSSAFLQPDQTRRLFGTLIWLSFLFFATLSHTQLLEGEVEGRAMDGMLLAKVPPSTMFLSKWMSGIAFILPAQLLSSAIIAGFVQISIGELFTPFLVITFLVIAAFAALATLLSAIAITSRLKGFLLPIILLPLLIPLYLAANELTLELVLQHRLAVDSPWFTLLMLMDVGYTAGGLLLFGTAIRE